VIQEQKACQSPYKSRKVPSGPVRMVGEETVKEEFVTMGRKWERGGYWRLMWDIKPKRILIVKCKWRDMGEMM